MGVSVIDSIIIDPVASMQLKHRFISPPWFTYAFILKFPCVCDTVAAHLQLLPKQCFQFIKNQ